MNIETLKNETKGVKDMHLGLDKNGKKIYIGMPVNVPEPNDDDMYSHAFTGYVYTVHGEYVTVCDSDDDCFDIEPERLEIEG